MMFQICTLILFQLQLQVVATVAFIGVSSPKCSRRVGVDDSVSSLRIGTRRSGHKGGGPSSLFPENGSKERSNHGSNDADISRRRMFSDMILRPTAVLCGCLGCAAPQAAHGLAQITAPSPAALSEYDLPRNQIQDAGFAQGMSMGMVDYEREAFPIKKRLFQKLFSSLEVIPEAVVVEVGMGSFPNAIYYKKMKGLDIIGVDPNDKMKSYAEENAARAGLVSKDSLRIIHGVSEALPLADASCDAVVCTLTLCSVIDPAKSVAEIKRVLKPGGKFLFWEHVLSETDPRLARQQVQLTPNQIKRADGCHLDRRTGDVISAAGFKQLDLEYTELKKFGFLNPTVCGIATA